MLLNKNHSSISLVAILRDSHEWWNSFLWNGCHIFLIVTSEPIDHPVNLDLALLWQSTLRKITGCSDHFVLTQIASYCCCIKLLYTLARLVPRDGVWAWMAGKGIKCWALMTCIRTVDAMVTVIIMQRKTHRNNFVASQLLCKIQVNCACRHTNTCKQTQTHTLTHSHTQTHTHTALLMGLAGAKMEMRLGNQSPGRGHS